MNPKQTYDDSEDPNKFPDIVSWVKMGKDDIHFVCKLCKTGLLKLSTMEITIVRGHSKPSKERKPPTMH